MQKPPLHRELFICLDCETTGLDTSNDQIIEIAFQLFNFNEVIFSYETLIDPQTTIPPESIAIHHISEEMVKGQPTIDQVLPTILEKIGSTPIVGHNISFDIEMIQQAAKRHAIPCKLDKNPLIDTVRLARIYGESPSNSLQALRQHFNIPEEGAHRAMSDVIVNVAVFKYLAKPFPSTKKILERLKNPIFLKKYPFGKYKDRLFSELPDPFLFWASKQDYDMDLKSSIINEINKRKNKKHSFSRASNPFKDLL